MTQNVVFCVAYFISCFYYAAYRIYFASAHLSVTPLNQRLEIVITVILVIKIILQTTRIRDVVVVIPLIALGILTWKYSHYPLVYFTAFFLAAGKNVRLKPLLVIAAVVFAGALIVAFCGVQMGYLENIAITKKGGIGHAWGTINVNTFGMLVFVSSLAVALVTPERFNYLKCAILLLFAYFVHVVSYSRTFVLALVFASICLFIYTLVKKANRPKLTRATIVFFVGFGLFCGAASIWFMVFFNSGNQLHVLLDSFSTRRLALNHYYYEIFDISLFGNNCSIKMTTPYHSYPERIIIDNGWARLFVHYGVVSLIAFIAANIGVLVKAFKERYFGIALVGLVACFIFGLTEHFNTYFAYCPYLLLISPLLFGQPLNIIDKPIRGKHSIARVS